MRGIDNTRIGRLITLLLVLGLTAYQLVRVIAFANVYGGIEHDSGWFLTVSRSLAERGTYTTLVSTIVDPTVPGDTSIDSKFNIQDRDGRIWFFTGSGTGPASIVPNAIVLKIFGFGYWALRAGPLLFFALLMLATAYVMYRLAGVAAIVIFHGFLFCYPRLSIFLSYEAMGEVAALFYAMWAYLAYAAATQSKRRRCLHFLGAGLVAGLAINTKMLALLSVGGITGWAGLRWLFAPAGERKSRVAELLSFGVGAVSLQLLWELVQMVVLLQLADFHMYLRHLQQRLGFIQHEGSGLGARQHVGVDFVWRKFLLLREVVHPEDWVTAIGFVAILLGSWALILLWRTRKPHAQNLLGPMWLGLLVNTAWFVGIAKTGWPRHFWFGLMLAGMLLSAIPVALIRLGWPRELHSQLPARPRSSLASKSGKLALLVSGFAMLALIAWGFASQPLVWSLLLPDKIVPYWLEHRYDYYDFAGLPWVVIPRAHQVEVVDYINNLPPEASVYYPEQYKAAEIAPQTGRIQYPLQRRFHPTVKPHPADIVLVPPPLISAWRFEPAMHQELLRRVEAACPNPVLRNDYYVICLADQVRLP